MRTQVILTIDNEVGESARHDPAGYYKYILGEIGDCCYGTPMIMDMLSEYGVTGEFFTDVYESKVFGDNLYADHCRFLASQSHGVQLHTHPGYMFDVERRNMHEYSASEQTEIIKLGKQLIEDWTGVTPLAHRAGMYGANNNTLHALIDNGICLDSSYYYRHPNCRMGIPAMNNPIWSDDVYVIPITVQKYHPKIFGLPAPFLKRYMKIDVNSLGANDMASAIVSLSHTIPYLIIFLHSSSFITRHGNGSIGVNLEAIESFRSALDTIRELKLEVVNFKHIQGEMSDARPIV